MLINYSYSKKIVRRCMEKYSLLTKLAKCTLNIALKLTFSVFLFFFVFWLHFTPRHCLRPFLERQFFTQMTVERREEKVGKPLLTGSALGGDKFRDICNMETIPPETDVPITNAHFPSFTSPKFPFPKSPTKWTIHVKLFNRQTTIGGFSLLGTVTDVSLLILHSHQLCRDLLYCDWLFFFISGLVSFQFWVQKKMKIDHRFSFFT